MESVNEQGATEPFAVPDGDKVRLGDSFEYVLAKLSDAYVSYESPQG